MGKSYKNILFGILVVAITMILNACSGGGSSTATVEEDNSNSATDTRFVLVAGENELNTQKNNTAPVAYAGKDKKVDVGDNVNLTAALIPDADGDRLTYIWSITQKPEGSDAKLSVRYSTTRNTSFRADVYGLYKVALLVRDEQGNTGADIVNVATYLIANDFKMIYDMTERVGSANWKDLSGTNNPNSEAEYVEGSCQFGWMEVNGNQVEYHLNSGESNRSVDTTCRLHIFDDINEKVVNVTVSPNSWKVVSTGISHTVAIRGDGTLWSWGGTYIKEHWIQTQSVLGDGNTNGYSTTPVQESTHSTEWVDVQAGANFTVALKSNGEIWTWGDNSYGQLGNGTYVDSLVPIKVPILYRDWKKISAFGPHVLALRSNGELWAWGKNDLGELGIGNNTNQSSPLRVGSSSDWIDVMSGGHHSLALKANGEIWAWGFNYYGQIGDGTRTSRNTPVLVSAGWAKLSRTWWYSSALQTNGTLWSWGSNGFGTLGDGTTIYRSSPVQEVTQNSDWSYLCGGCIHNAVIKNNNTLWSWGFNRSGTLGDGTTTDRSSPVQESTQSSDWEIVSGGWLYTVALKNDGTLWAWGENDRGQLGTGDLQIRLNPTLMIE
jgi:alpha-tubulin suppressor-like RCC1 family protein